MIQYFSGTIPGVDGERPIAVLRDDTHLSRWIENSRRLDADDPVLLARIMDLIPPGSVVVDAGASLGDHAALYSTKAKIVHAFEPQPESFLCLAWNAAGRENVWPRMLGLSDREGLVSFARNPNVGAGRIGPGEMWIQTVQLDRLELDPGLIKLDVEGHEIPALRGARETILRSRPVLVVEVNKWQMDPAGFSIRDLWMELDGLGYHHCKDIRTGAPFDPADGKPEYDIVGTPC